MSSDLLVKIHFWFYKVVLNQNCGFFQHFLALFENFTTLYNDSCIKLDLFGWFWYKETLYKKIFLKMYQCPMTSMDANDFRRATTSVDFFSYSIKCWPLSRLVSAFKTLLQKNILLIQVVKNWTGSIKSTVQLSIF